MTADTTSARSDLAFLKAIADDDPAHTLRPAGAALLTGGLVYGFQCFANWAALAIPLELPTWAWLALSFGPTVVFVAALVWILARSRAPAPRGATSRGVNAAFQAAGVTNLVLIAIFAPGALRAQDWTIWFYYPAVLLALWGAVWLIVGLLRRRAWHGAVSAGAFAAAVTMAQLRDSAELYVLVLGAALIAVLAVPGYVLMRNAQKEAAS
jgi:hypothetical protein